MFLPVSNYITFRLKENHRTRLDDYEVSPFKTTLIAGYFKLIPQNIILNILFMHVYIHIYAYIYMHEMHVYAYDHTDIYAFIYDHMYVCI